MRDGVGSELEWDLPVRLTRTERGGGGGGEEGMARRELAGV
jgi:hypothetical protein